LDYPEALKERLNSAKLGRGSPVYLGRLVQIHRLLEIYERVCLLDDTCFIRPDCPNIFDIVPPDSVGGFNEMTLEDFSSHKIDRRFIKEKKGDDIRFYLNVGVLVVSKAQSDLFGLKNIVEHIELFESPYPTQCYLNFMLHRNEIPVHHLDRSYNFVPVFDYLSQKSRKMKRLKPKQVKTCKNNFIVHVTGYYSFRERILRQLRRSLWGGATSLLVKLKNRLVRAKNRMASVFAANSPGSGPAGLS
jgi:lipopolysaccharide biosynthesis glycosyltransferase